MLEDDPETSSTIAMARVQKLCQEGAHATLGKQPPTARCPPVSQQRDIVCCLRPLS